MQFRVSVDIALEPSVAFDEFVAEMSQALTRVGMRLEPGKDGRILEGKVEVGRVLSWLPGKEVLFEWRQANWKPDEVTKMGLRFEPVPDGTRVTIEHDQWGSLLGDRGGELAGWFATEVAGPLFQAMGPRRFGDWLTDRHARRPSGAQARSGYRDPVYHRPNFKVILRELSLTPSDFLLEVGCGGGALLQEALRSGCRAAAVDHSPEMVKLAQEVNHDAIKQRRLEVREAEADQLPFPNGKFTCAALTNVFGFLPDPHAVLVEIRRVLAKDGRLVFFTVSPEMRGTIAAPEPMASRIHFYKDEELMKLAREAGFVDVRVERPNLEPFAREAGVPEEHIQAFSGRDGQLTIALKT